MTGIIGIVALLSVLAISLVVTRVATIALMFTGLSAEAARFQARSAFTGTGFTTGEAETVVEHPVRRRIIMALMLVRSAGVITIFLSIILSFMGPEGSGKLSRLVWLAGGVLAMWFVSRSRVVDRAIKRIMIRAVRRWPEIEVMDYTGMLHLSGDYVIRELPVEEGDWIAGRDLRTCKLREEGVVAIGIHRADGSYVGVPKGDTQVHPGDRLVVYGLADNLRNLDRRHADPAGDRQHAEAVDDERRRQKDEENNEPRSNEP